MLAKDSLSRRAVQTVLAEVLQTLTLLISPVLSFTAEEIWSYIPFKNGESVMLASWPDLPSYYEDERLAERWDVLLQLREEVNRALEAARKEKIIGSSLQASVELYPDEELYEKLVSYDALLPTVLIVSSTVLHKPGDEPGQTVTHRNSALRLKVKRTRGKCQRCWMLPTVERIKNMKGMLPLRKF